MLKIMRLEGRKHPKLPYGVTYQHDEQAGLNFNQSQVIQMLVEIFPEAKVLPGDVLLENAKETECLLIRRGQPNNPLIDSLYRRASELGPVKSISITTSNGEKLEAAIRRYDIIFKFDNGISINIKNKMKQFLEAFSIGEIIELLEN